MATIYEVLAPDGSILEIEGPDGATDAQIMQAAAELYQPQQQAAPQQPGQAPQFGSMETAAEIPGLEQPYPAPQPEPTMGEYATGAAETLGTMATGATTGLLGAVGGAVEGTARSIAGGQYKTEGFAPMAAEYAQRGMQAGTYEPRGRVAPEVLKAIGEPLSQLPPVLGAGGLPTAGRAARAGAALPREMVSAGIERLPGAAGRAETARSVGAAQTPDAIRRAAIAESMPVPFTGESGVTLGQATRDFELLQFEKESAKNPELGRPLRERVEKQSAVLQSNLDALFESAGPVSIDTREIGQAVDQALVNRMNIQKKKYQKLYEEAEVAGEMADDVVMYTIPAMLDSIDEASDVAGNVAAFRKSAIKRGIVQEAADGSLQPNRVSVNDAEGYRKAVNALTDIYDPQQVRIRRIAINAIDEATKDSGGPIYQDARKARAKFAQEFENVGITKRLLAEKKGTSERTIAFEDVFKKIILDSPIEEINKLRSTLLKGGPKGKQAWMDLKAKTIDYIKESSISPSQTDSRGLPLLSPDKLSKTVAALDTKGKLEMLYGKKQAQILRDLAEISRVIYTAPPGAVNHSNTTSALMVAMDSLGGFAVSGLPAPMLTIIREAAKYSKNRALKARIAESLKPIRPASE
jgi:hypothetical protein